MWLGHSDLSVGVLQTWQRSFIEAAADIPYGLGNTPAV